MNSIKKWIPAKNIPNSLCIESITDDYNGLKIMLANEHDISQSLILHFSDYYGYRNFDESERLHTLNCYPELTVQWSLFIAENTDFIKWLYKESLEIVDRSEIKHYIIGTSNDIFEVLSSEVPEVIWGNAR